MELKYQLNDKPTLVENLLYGAQWGIIILSVNLFFPLVLAQTLGFSPSMTADLVQRTLLGLGLATLIQLLFGHRITVFETVAAVWLSVFFIVAQMGARHNLPLDKILGQVEFLIILTGALIILVSLIGATGIMQRIFTPTVMGITLILITFQISQGVIKGMTGLENGRINPQITLFAFTLFLATLFLSVKGGYIKSFVGLIGLLGGRLIYTILGFPGKPIENSHFIYIPKIFDFGPPVVNWDLVPFALLIVIIYFSNVMASVNAGAYVLDKKIEKGDIKRSGLTGGIIHILCAVLSSIPLVPAAMAAGFIATTGVGAKKPLYIGSIFLVFLGIIAPIGSFFAAIPAPVAYGVSLSIFAQIVSLGIRNCYIGGINERNLLITGVSLTIGCGFILMPAGAFADVPIFGSTLENGIFIGVMTALLLEHIIFPFKKEKTSENI